MFFTSAVETIITDGSVLLTSPVPHFSESQKAKSSAFSLCVCVCVWTSVVSKNRNYTSHFSSCCKSEADV